MSEANRNPDLTAIENALSGLVPRTGGINRDQLMFRAGQASAARRGWAWPCATALLALASVTLGAAQLWRPTPQQIEHTVYVRVEVPVPVENGSSVAMKEPAPTSPLTAGEDHRERAQGAYFKLQEQVLRWGLDALAGPPPPPPSRSESPLTIDSLLGTRPTPQDSSGWLSWPNFIQ
jgi:hypothetical protein